MTKTSAMIVAMEAIQKAKVRLSNAKKEECNIINNLYHSDFILHFEHKSFCCWESMDHDLTIANIENELEQLEGAEDDNERPKNILSLSASY